LRFLALFGVLWLAKLQWWSIRGGGSRWGKECERRIRGAALSPRQTENQKERAVELFGRFCVDAANNPPNAVAAERDQFICHDLGPKAKTVRGRNFDQRSQRKSVL